MQGRYVHTFARYSTNAPYCQISMMHSFQIEGLSSPETGNKKFVLCSEQIFSYFDAFNLARSGNLDGNVLRSLQAEHERCTDFGCPIFHLLHVKTMLGISLLKIGSKIESSASSAEALVESERLLLSALQLRPHDALAKVNLDKLQSNKQQRAWLDPAFGRAVETATMKSSSSKSGAHREHCLPLHSELKPLDSAAPTMLYEDALVRAVQGTVDGFVIDAMRAEILRAAGDPAAPPEHLLSVKVNLGSALMNLGNRAEAEEADSIYAESEQVLLSVLAMDPGHALAAENLRRVLQNRALRAQDLLRVFNPSVTFLSPGGPMPCQGVLLRRLVMRQFTGNLLTCEDRFDAGLLWFHEPEAIMDAREWHASFRASRPDRRVMCYDSRLVEWRGDLCWVSAVSGRDFEYLQFHCIGQERLAAQLERSRLRAAILPLLGARGGTILATHSTFKEKNWSPFVVGNELYIIYSLRPYMVMACDWESGPTLALRCVLVQNTTSPAHETAPTELRGSSAGVALSRTDDDFIALGHVSTGVGYRTFLYRFVGDEPPFNLTAFSPLFDLPTDLADGGGEHAFRYAHGLGLRAGELIVTYGVKDRSSWRVRVPLEEALPMLPRHSRGPGQQRGDITALAVATPGEYPPELFNQNLFSVLTSMVHTLNASGHPLAAQLERLLAMAARNSGSWYEAAADELRSNWLLALVELQKADRDECLLQRMASVCNQPGGSWSLSHAVKQAQEEAEAASLAYFILVLRESTLLSSLARRGWGLAEQDDEPGGSKGSRPELWAGRTPPPGKLSYDAALKRAVEGDIDSTVLEAMRQEDAALNLSAASGSKIAAARLSEVKVNLGTALLELGNRAKPAEYAALYQESEVLFLQALALVPDNEWAKQNLIILHRNRSLRA